MSVRRLLSSLMALSLFMAACSSSGTARTPQETVPPTTVPPTTTTEAAAAPDSVVEDSEVVMAGVDGLIASAGPTGLRILRPTGELVAQFAENSVVTQPTWSRDASRIVATFFSQDTGLTEIGIIDTATWELTTETAFRPYFFYSWNDDATLLAALGPGNSGGTSVDFLDLNAAPASNTPLAGGSMYVAWEPGGTDLLLHANDQMLLIDDLASIETSENLGRPGANFQTISWIPGTRDYVFVDSSDGDGRLIRANLESDDRTDLGAAPGFALVAVHPDGEVAALARADSGADSGIVNTALAQDTGPAAVIELVDLTTGERTPILDTIGFWLEWSPDGNHLLMATAVDDGFGWKIWNDDGVADMGAFVSTPSFFQNYIPFSDQYTETPRLWSPDSTSFTFGSVLDGVPSATAIRIDDGATSRVGVGDVAFWSPVPVPGQ